MRSPIGREISPVAPASRTLEADRRPAAGRRRLLPASGELERNVMAAASGDRTAVSALVERFAPRIRALARAHRLAPHDVEDVMQTTWLRLLEHVDTIHTPSAIGAWLATTARRESLRILEANNCERTTDDELLLDATALPVDEEILRANERCAAERRAAARAAGLAVAREQLPGRQRQLLSMLLSDPTPSYAEISHALGMPIGSIGPTRERTLERLRQNENFHGLSNN
jgi:RNA polymerase sigma factor (sigma-70 family)